jgi:hypothetical protein
LYRSNKNNDGNGISVGAYDNSFLQIKISDSKTFLQNIYQAAAVNFLQAGNCISNNNMQCLA